MLTECTASHRIVSNRRGNGVFFMLGLYSCYKFDASETHNHEETEHEGTNQKSYYTFNEMMHKVSTVVLNGCYSSINCVSIENPILCTA